MPDAAWKKGERRVAKYLGLKRTWMEGQDVGEEESNLSGEVKYRNELPQWLKEAAKQAARNAAKGKIPFVVLLEKGKHVQNALVLMTLQDFREWFGEALEIVGAK